MTLDSGTEPGDSKPPVIPSLSVPATEAVAKPWGGRQPIALLLNICLGLFLVDAILSLMDDTLVLFVDAHFLSGIRGVLGTFALLFALLVYVLMGFTPTIPKWIFLPVTLFNPAALLLAIPAWIYFYDHAQLVSCLISLIQVVFVLAILWGLQGGFKWRWPLIPEGLIEGPPFSWANLLGFWASNLLLVLPGVIAYLLVCSALAIGHFSDGFVALRPVGFTVQVREYVRDDGKSILLVPMSHIGEPEFYRSLSRSFPTNSMILMEGVTDDKNLLTNRISYKRMANSLGLAQQQREFKPSPIQIVQADIDVDQFRPSTISFLNMVMLIHSKGLTLENMLQLMQCSGPPGFEEQLFDDILHKRNQHLLQQIHDQFLQSDILVVPWAPPTCPRSPAESKNQAFTWIAPANTLPSGSGTHRTPAQLLEIIPRPLRCQASLRLQLAQGLAWGQMPALRHPVLLGHGPQLNENVALTDADAFPRYRQLQPLSQTGHGLFYRQSSHVPEYKAPRPRPGKPPLAA